MSDCLCEVLIVEIFTRLPPKSLLRFRSLSKSCYSCISSPYFIHMHTSRSPQKFLIRHQRLFKMKDFYTLRGEDLYTLHGEDQLPFCPEGGYSGISSVQFPFGGDVYIVGSCNGILCLCDYTENRIILWNPSIRRKLTLPDCPQRCLSSLSIGIGFNPITLDYKIVSIYNQTSFVYAMKTGTWRAIAYPTPPFDEVLPNVCFVNGALHWVVEVEPYIIETYDIVGRCCILTFDLSTDVFGSIGLLETSSETCLLTTIQGSLALITYPMENDDDDCWIWVRRDASWSVVLKLNTYQRVCRVLQLSCNGALLLDMWFHVQVYNPKICTQLSLVNFSANYHLSDIVSCVESLHLLDMGTACEVNQVSNKSGIVAPRRGMNVTKTSMAAPLDVTRAKEGEGTP